MNLQEILKNSELGKDNSDFYNNNKPYPYIVIDNFFDDYQNLITQLNELHLQSEYWNMQRNSLVRLDTFSGKCTLPKKVSTVFNKFSNKKFIDFLQKLTNFYDLQLDKKHNPYLFSIPRFGRISPQTSPQRISNNSYRKVTVLANFNTDLSFYYESTTTVLSFYNENPFSARNFIKMLPNRVIIFNSEDMIFSIDNKTNRNFLFGQFNFYNKELPKRELIINTRFF